MKVFFKKSIVTKLNSKKSLISNKLYLFKYISYSPILKFQKWRVWSNYFKTIASFKSFFGFLKPKPFLMKVKFNLLNVFSLNPKPYTLTQLVSKSKKYKSDHINSLFNSASSFFFISKQKLSNIFFKLKLFKKNKINFLLFKHKIYNYTTPKHYIYPIIIKQTLCNSDFRTGMLFKVKAIKFPNISTISTYNWKSIN